MAFIFKWEGGYVNHAEDPGGETKYGISKRAHPDVDIKELTKAQAEEIYYRDYWLKAGCDKLPWPDCVVHFDAAVNMGVGRAQGFSDLAEDWTHYIFLRLQYYSDLVRRKPKLTAFIRGWLNRVTDLYETARVLEHPVSTEYGKKPPR
jgi:lysozyme family protein